MQIQKKHVAESNLGYTTVAVDRVWTTLAFGIKNAKWLNPGCHHLSDIFDY